MKKILSAFLLGVTLFTAGCDKEKIFFKEELNSAQTGAGFGLPNQTPLNLTVEGTTTIYTEAINAFVDNNGSASLTLAVDESLVAAYNDANGTAFEVMPSDVYTFPTSISVSGGSGSSDATFDIQKLLTYGTSFAIGVKITNASGGTNYVLPGNSQKVILVQVKNKYDGMYTLKVKTVGWAAYNISDGVAKQYPGQIEFFTSGATSNDWMNTARPDNLLPAFDAAGNATAFGATSPRFTFDAATDKLVSVINVLPDDGRGRTLRINPAITDSRYDESTATIYAAFIMSQTGRPDQYFYDTLSYVGPR